MKKTSLLKRVLLVALCCALVFTTACKNDPDTTSSAPPTDTSNTPGPVVTGDTYTLNYAMIATPLTWSPHTWETNADSELSLYIETQLIDTTISADGVNFEWVYEAATAINDVTATFADKEKWGIEADAEEGYVYTIDLEPKLTWSDGTPINAASYVYSMQQVLNPDMKNYRANSYYNSDTTIRNALGYYMNDLVGQNKYGPAVDENYDPIEADTYYFNADEYVAFLGDLFMAYYETSYQPFYFDADGNDLSAKYVDMGWVEVTDEVKADLLTIALNFGDENPGAWYEFASVVVGQYEETKWEDVGLYASGEYQLTYIVEEPVTMFYFLTAMTSTWLVNERLYEAGKEVREGLLATNYNTTLDTTLSFGPYKLISFEKDKQMVLTRNESWYGWTDGKHDGQYMTTDIKIDIVADHNTELQLFNQGLLDTIDLQSDDMAVYRMSDYLRKTDQTYTFRYIFGTSLESLTALESEAGDGANKKVLYYDDFRKAISLAMDRARFTNEATAAFKPAYYLYNYLYYYDIENDTSSIYRNTDQAKEAVLRLYGITYGPGTPYADATAAYNAVTGYNEDEARKLFQSVYEQAIADGLYTDGQAININCMASAGEAPLPDDLRQQDLLNEMVGEATKGTGFEGKITFKFMTGAKKRYDDVANGVIEMIRGAWGGAAFYPFSTIRCYTEPDYMGGLNKIHESNGWNPITELLDVTYDFDGDGTAETVTDTFQNWAKSINGAGAHASDPKASMVILSYLETGVLSAYQCIPFAAETLTDMYSMQLKWATLDYNIMYGYGGIRLLTYNYTDADWTKFVADNGGTLNYE